MSFAEKMREMVTKGVAASREAISKAGSQAQTWGEMGVLKIEIVQYRNMLEKLTAQLGAEVYDAFIDRGQASVAADSPDLRDLIAKIRDTEAHIKEREERYRKLGGKEDDLQK